MIQLKSLVCPVCCGDKFSKLRNVYDDRYGQPDLFTLVKCDSCSHLMTTPMFSEDELPELYGTYYPRKKLYADTILSEAERVKLHFGKIRRWWNGTNNQGQYRVRSGEKILDIGCGSGLSLLEAQALGADAWGIEADPNVKKIAQQLGLKIHQGNLKDMPFVNTSFDLVVLNQVIEHIPEPDKALLAIQKLLDRDGRVIMVFPNIKSFWCKLTGGRWINWHVPYHLHHFNKTTFTHMIERCGFKVVNSRTITPNVWTIQQLRVFKGAVIRGQENPAWNVRENIISIKNNISLAGFIRKVIVAPIMLAITAINRVIDIIGLGDSLIVEIRPTESI